MFRWRPRMRRLVVPAAAALFLLVATVCNPLAAPIGAAPLRYRDAIFTAVSKTLDISYGSAVDQTNQTIDLTLDLYQPTGDTVTNRPAIVWIHGGGFGFGSKTSPELVDEANYFALRGYVNVSIRYRLAPGGCVNNIGQSCLTGILQAREDAQTAVRFLRENASTYRIDSSRIAIGGTSAGAITALNVGYSAEDPGPGDHQGYSSAVRAVQSFSGAALASSPIDGSDAPALFFHGTADTLVPLAWAQATVRDAKAVNLVAILRTWQGAGHTPYVENRTQILEETRNFFYSMMDLAHAAG